jgi:hypothetical protein
LDLDGSLLITNDPFVGVTADNGVMSFASAPEKFGVRVKLRAPDALAARARVGISEAFDPRNV